MKARDKSKFKKILISLASVSVIFFSLFISINANNNTYMIDPIEQHVRNTDIEISDMDYDSDGVIDEYAITSVSVSFADYDLSSVDGISINVIDADGNVFYSEDLTNVYASNPNAPQQYISCNINGKNDTSGLCHDDPEPVSLGLSYAGTYVQITVKYTDEDSSTGEYTYNEYLASDYDVISFNLTHTDNNAAYFEIYTDNPSGTPLEISGMFLDSLTKSTTGINSFPVNWNSDYTHGTFKITGLNPYTTYTMSFTLTDSTGFKTIALGTYTATTTYSNPDFISFELVDSSSPGNVTFKLNISDPSNVVYSVNIIETSSGKELSNVLYNYSGGGSRTFTVKSDFKPGEVIPEGYYTFKFSLKDGSKITTGLSPEMTVPLYSDISVTNATNEFKYYSTSDPIHYETDQWVAYPSFLLTISDPDKRIQSLYWEIISTDGKVLSSDNLNLNTGYSNGTWTFKFFTMNFKEKTEYTINFVVELSNSGDLLDNELLTYSYDFKTNSYRDTEPIEFETDVEPTNGDNSINGLGSPSVVPDENTDNVIITDDKGDEIIPIDDSEIISLNPSSEVKMSAIEIAGITIASIAGLITLASAWLLYIKRT